jgi:hypothetical protein
VEAVDDLVGERDRHLREAGGGQPGLVLGLGQRAGDAADVAAPLGPLLGVRWSSATTSLAPRRPPGLRTRKVSANTAGLSTDRLTTQLEITTSTVAAGSGMASMWPLRNSTLRAPAA